MPFMHVSLVTKTNTMKKEQSKQPTASTKGTQKGTQNMDELQQQADEQLGSRKPGSQSNSSKQHNNGRGGGK